VIKKILEKSKARFLYEKERPSKDNQNQVNSPVRVHVDGHILTFDTNPVIENDTTLVGFRSILEQLGMKVTWYGETRLITITSK